MINNNDKDNKQNQDKEGESTLPTDTAELAMCDHILIRDMDSGKVILNRRG